MRKLGRNKFPKRRHNEACFQTKNCSTLTGSITQHDRIWVVNRAEANIKGGTRQIRKFPQRVMVWLGACSKGLSPLVIFENGTVDHNHYINEVLPVVLKYGNSIFLGMIELFNKMVPSHTSMKKT